MGLKKFQNVDPPLTVAEIKELKPGVTYTWTGTLTVPVTDTYYLCYFNPYGNFVLVVQAALRPTA
jgi:hypothetical protein